MSRRSGPLLLIGLIAGLAACADADAGVVEINWAIVDLDGDPIYPDGVFTIGGARDSCGFDGRRSETDVRYDLHVELEICDTACAGGCDDPACHVIPTKRFPCDVSRGSDPEVPAGDDPYRFTVRAVLETGGADCVPAPDCVAVPGPRERTVQRGLVTDLQVYQIALGVDIDANTPLDLDVCGCA